MKAGDNKIGRICFAAVFVAIMVMLSATAVPNVQGAVVAKRINEAETAKEISNILTRVDKAADSSSDKETLKSVFVVLLVTEQLIKLFRKSTQTVDISSLEEKIDTTQQVTKEIVIAKTQDCLDSLMKLIDEKYNKDQLTPGEIEIIDALKAFLSRVQSALNNDDSLQIVEEKYKLEGVLRGVIAVIGLILLALIALVGWTIRGIIRTIGNIIRVIVLILAGVQGVLTLSALYVLFMGAMSYIGFKLASYIGAPLFGFIASRLTIVIGSLLGALSLFISSVIAFLLVFAIPLIILIIIYFIFSQQGGGETLANFLEAILESLFGTILQFLPGLENFLHGIWDIFARFLPNWSEWPF